MATAALPPLTPEDADTLVAILEAADAGSGGRPPVLLDVLHAYERVLAARGRDPKADTFFYRYLLQVSLHPAALWWEKVAGEQAVRRPPCLVCGYCFPAASPHLSPPTTTCSDGDSLWMRGYAYMRRPAGMQRQRLQRQQQLARRHHHCCTPHPRCHHHHHQYCHRQSRR